MPEQKELFQKLNSQPIEKFESHLRGSVDIVSIFSTIQGEGPFSGYPAVFIRTAGCNLQCPWCDTDYTTDRHIYTPPQVVDIVQEMRKRGLIVITGGEPFRQNISPLVRLLVNTGYHVQVETNGALPMLDLFPRKGTTIVCSPKTPKIALSHGQYDCLKYVLSADAVDEEDGLPTSVLGSNVRPYRPEQGARTPIYVSPADEYNEEKNEANLRAAIRSALYFDYILSIQHHKNWGLP